MEELNVVSLLSDEFAILSVVLEKTEEELIV
jgi:hypothetical protein